MNVTARIVLAVMLAYPAAAGAAGIVCRVTVTPFSFGNYVPGDTAPLDVTGRIDVRCNGNAPGSFTATLSTGGSGTFMQRQMLSGTYVMLYNLYVNPSRTAIWGDGTGGSQTVSRVMPQPGRQDYVLPVYGRVFPLQSVAAGLYSDDVLVTVVF